VCMCASIHDVSGWSARNGSESDLGMLLEIVCVINVCDSLLGLPLFK
jgi:hypothetical protein